MKEEKEQLMTQEKVEMKSIGVQGDMEMNSVGVQANIELSSTISEEIIQLSSGNSSIGAEEGNPSISVNIEDASLGRLSFTTIRDGAAPVEATLDSLNISINENPITER